MKKWICFFTMCFTIAVTGCHDATKDQKSAGKENKPASTVDSLGKEIDDQHIIGMSKMGRLTRAGQAAIRMLDSISKLPAKARRAAEPFRVKLDSLQKELNYAEIAMDKWMMDDLKRDSLTGQMKLEDQIKYLNAEKLKVLKVKDNILLGIQKADSLIKDRF